MFEVGIYESRISSHYDFITNGSNGSYIWIITAVKIPSFGFEYCIGMSN